MTFLPIANFLSSFSGELGEALQLVLITICVIILVVAIIISAVLYFVWRKRFENSSFVSIFLYFVFSQLPLFFLFLGIMALLGWFDYPVNGRIHPFIDKYFVPVGLLGAYAIASVLGTFFTRFCLVRGERNNA